MHTQSIRHDKMSPASNVAMGHHVDEKRPESILASTSRFFEG